jgi:hypothetical protein
MKITLNELRQLVKSVIREEMEKSEEDNDPISMAKNKAKQEKKYNWLQDALAHGFTEEEIGNMTPIEIEKLIDYLDSAEEY